MCVAVEPVRRGCSGLNKSQCNPGAWAKIQHLDYISGACQVKVTAARVPFFAMRSPSEFCPFNPTVQRERTMICSRARDIKHNIKRGIPKLRGFQIDPPPHVLQVLLVIVVGLVLNMSNCPTRIQNIGNWTRFSHPSLLIMYNEVCLCVIQVFADYEKLLHSENYVTKRQSLKV